MTTKECIAYYGSVRALASALNITRQAVYKWPLNEPPLHRQYELQLKTNNALKASQGVQNAN